MSARHCLGALLLTLAAGAASAAESSLVQLLKVGWDTRPAARNEAEEIFRQYIEEQPADARAYYAYALVRMQQGRYPEAGELLDKALRFDRNHLNAWRARSWISMLTRKHDAALAELDRLSQLLDDAMQEEVADAKVARRRQQQHRELVGYLGRMIGYLEGAAAGSVSASAVEGAKRKIVERLDGTLQEEFEAQRSAVVDQFNVLATAKDDAQVQEIMAAEKQKRERLAQIERLEADAAVRKDELKTESDKVKSEAQAASAQYAAADRPLADELSRLRAQAARLESDLSSITIDISRVRADLARERDPIRRERLLFELDRLEGIAARIDGDLLAVERRAAGVQSQRGTLLAQHRQTQGAYAATLQKAQQEYNSLENQLRRANSERLKLSKPASGTTGKVLSMAKEAVALSTYEVFPLEAERQRLLDELAAP